MHSSTNVASVQPQFNAQTDKLNRKRAGSKRSFYKGKMPQVQVKEELRRLVALEYPGADVVVYTMLMQARRSERMNVM